MVACVVPSRAAQPRAELALEEAKEFRLIRPELRHVDLGEARVDVLADVAQVQ